MFLMALVRTRCFGSICLSPLRMRDGKWRKLLAWTPSRRGGLRLEEQAEPGVEQGQGYLRVTVLAACGKEADPSETAWVDCYVGENWVVTAHTVQLAVIDDFREHAEGEGAIGILDAPSFLSHLLEWVVTSYLRAFDRIEVDLEEFDVRVLESTRHDAEGQIGQLVEVRRHVGKLRRSLAPHREVFAALGKSEFDPVSSEGSAERFVELVARTDTALAAARDAKDAIMGSFDVLIARTEHRTNQIMKVLTLASVLLLPGALIAGVTSGSWTPEYAQRTSRSCETPTPSSSQRHQRSSLLRSGRTTGRP